MSYNLAYTLPDALSSIDRTGAVASIDAMGAQREIAELIVDKGGHSFLALKANQKFLYEDVACAFKLHKGYDSDQPIDADHGRIETRHCSILSASEFLMEETLEPWKGLHAIMRIESTREVKGKSTQGPRYYIGDEKELIVKYFNALARGRWGIENQLHWYLDVTFKEDQCRVRTGYASQNLSGIEKTSITGGFQTERRTKHKGGCAKRL